MQLLGGLSASDFLRRYWQKRPLLVRQALPGFHCPISPDELAGLACEDDVEARIVIEREGRVPWQLEHGPFEESRFATLPDTHWTLLVQEVNKYVPEVDALLEKFSFIPRWRIDDIMVSYAPEHGSVGPHVDQYDVFLIQGWGQRRWQINPEPVSAENFIPHTALRIMREFTPQDEWVLEPGDMLYLPPGVAHHGVALNECMTLSVGFRAPSHADILIGIAEHIAARLGDEQRYTDPDLRVTTHPGEIDPVARARVKTILEHYLGNDASIDEWFGRFVTEPREGQPSEPAHAQLSTEQFTQMLAGSDTLERCAHSRYAYAIANGVCTLFVDGEAQPVPPELHGLAALLANQRRWSAPELEPWLSISGATALLAGLHAAGTLRFVDDDE